MNREFNFIENFEINKNGETISKIELIEDGEIVTSIIGANNDDMIYKLHFGWVYPNRVYKMINGEETFEETK